MAQSSHTLSFVSPTPEAVQHALQQALTTTFEEMVFMQVEEMAEAELEASQVYARLPIFEPVRCSFTLSMNEGVVDACIDALYCGTPITDAVRQDIANELANTIAGLLMSNLDEAAAISLGLPSGGRGLPAPENGKTLAHAYRTDVGSLRVTVSL